MISDQMFGLLIQLYPILVKFESQNDKCNRLINKWKWSWKTSYGTVAEKQTWIGNYK